MDMVIVQCDVPGEYLMGPLKHARGTAAACTAVAVWSADEVRYRIREDALRAHGITRTIYIGMFVNMQIRRTHIPVFLKSDCACQSMYVSTYQMAAVAH